MTTISRTNRSPVKNDAMICNALRTAAKIINGPSSATSRAGGARMDDDKIPDWVYRRFSWPDGESPASMVPLRSARSHRTTARLQQAHALEPAVSDLVHVALTRTGYPMQHIRCCSDEETLRLSGFVTRYFYAQIALEIALRLANGRRIEANIDVLPATDRDQWDD